MAPERCLKISTAILRACRCLSNDDISNSIRAIAAICQFGNYLRVTEGYLRMKAMETRLRARRAPFGLPAEGEARRGWMCQAPSAP